MKLCWNCKMGIQESAYTYPVETPIEREGERNIINIISEQDEYSEHLVI